MNRTPSHPLLAVLAASMMAGCASDKSSGASDSASPSDAEFPSAATGGDTAIESGDGSVLTYTSVEGALSVVGGAADPGGSELILGFWTADQRLLCSGSMVLTQLIPEPFEPAELPLYGWWRAAVERPPECAGFPAHPSLIVGIGAYDGQLDPAAAAAGYPPEAAYASYVRLDDEGPVLVYGLAGTAGVFAGTEDPVTEAPLPDGRYRLVGLHLLPLP